MRIAALNGAEWINSEEKRAMDITIATAMLPVATPLGAVALGLSRLIDGEGAIFRHERVGHNGEPITINKIRTMRHPDPELNGHELDSDRITRLGSKLRPLGIDEIPQLANVLDGSLSLVGPRVSPIYVFEDMEASVPKVVYERWLESYLASKPGLLSSQTLFTRSSRDDELSFEQRYFLRAQFDLYDFRHSSLAYDSRLIARAGGIGLRHMFNAIQKMESAIVNNT